MKNVTKPYLIASLAIGSFHAFSQDSIFPLSVDTLPWENLHISPSHLDKLYQQDLESGREWTLAHPEASPRDRPYLNTHLAVSSSLQNATDGHLHMTITYLGEKPTESALHAFEQLSKVIASSRSYPLELEVIEHDHFGPNNRVHVLRVKILDIEIESKLIAFHQAHGIIEMGRPTKPHIPNFHISIQPGSGLEDAAPGTRLIATAIEARRYQGGKPFFSKALYQ